MRTVSYAFMFSCCVLFVFIAASLAGAGGAMFIDTDPLWHIAAGDLIRTLGAIPAHDSWSFTAGDYRWLNISWAWDSAFSAIKEHFGWHGALAVNAIIIAFTLTLIYVTATLRSKSAWIAFITLIAVMTLMSLHLRPLQITNLLTALWMLILGNTMRGQISARWLALLPLSMLLWVNMHGGFIVGPVMLLAFFLYALMQKNHILARALLYTGLITFLALFCNPYGFDIIEAVRRPLTTSANEFIIEWQSVLSAPANIPGYMYIGAFLLLTLRRMPTILPPERWLAYFWLIAGCASIRHLPIFAIMSAPIFAASLAEKLPSLSFTGTVHESLLRIYNHRLVAQLGMILCVIVALWLPSPQAARHFHQETIVTPTLAPEIAYIQKHYPKARLFNHFNLGAIIAYETHGAIPVFIDPRTETAYPPSVMADYAAFLKAKPNWEKLLDLYHIDLILLPNDFETELLARLDQHKGWKRIFTGPKATLYIRNTKA